MNKLFVSVLITLILLNAGNVLCSEKQNSHSSTVINLKVNVEEEKKIQIEVDKGHQPWRLEPIDVAFAALNDVDKEVVYENCHLINKTDRNAEVQCKGKRIYYIYLKRIVRTDGIWTAESIKILTQGNK